MNAHEVTLAILVVGLCAKVVGATSSEGFLAFIIEMSQ